MSQLQRDLELEEAGGDGEDAGHGMSRKLWFLSGAPQRVALADLGPVSGATDEDLAAINRMPMVNRALTAEDVYVRVFDAINTRPIVSYGLILGAEEVGEIAKKCVGAPVMANHDTGWLVGRLALPLGRTFAASTFEQDGVTWCRMKNWFDRSEAANVEKMDTGVISEVSVSFDTPNPFECTICGKDIESPECPHMPGEEYDGRKAWGRVRGVGDYYETSACWKGAAEGTRIRIAAGFDLAGLRERKIAARSPFAHLYSAPAPDPLAHLYAKPELDLNVARLFAQQ